MIKNNSYSVLWSLRFHWLIDVQTLAIMIQYDPYPVTNVFSLIKTIHNICCTALCRVYLQFYKATVSFTATSYTVDS